MSTSALAKEQKKLEANEEAAKRDVEVMMERLAKIDALLRRGAGSEYLRNRYRRAA